MISTGAGHPDGRDPDHHRPAAARRCWSPARTSRGRPSASKATSTPRPSVSSRTRATTSSVEPLTVWVAPSSRAAAELVVADVDRDDRRGAERPRHLDDVRADAAGRHDRHRLAGPQIGAAADGAVRREDRAAEDRRLVERQARRAAAQPRSPGRPRTRPARPSSTSRPASRRRGAAGCRRRRACPARRLTRKTSRRGRPGPRTQ